MKSIRIIFSLLLISSSVCAEIKPAPGAKLNYNQVMLEYDQIENATEYVVEVSAGTIGGENLERIKEIRDRSTATLIENLNFGSSYVWRYAGIVGGAQTEWRGPFAFSIEIDTTIGLDKPRFKVSVNNETEGKKGLFAVGSSKTIIDKAGSPVWYVPKIDDKIFIEQSNITEFRMSDVGTILLYSSTGFSNGISLVCETDLQGKILWKAPNDGQVSGDTTEYYHHDFKRLANGNYMVLGCKYGWRNVPPDVDLKNIRKVNIDSVSNPKRIKYLFNTIIEYNKAGKVVWSWDLNDHISDEELFATGVVTNAVRRELPARAELYGHMNSFDADPMGEYVYASFRDIHDVFKIRKSTGKVVYRYHGKKDVSPDSKEIHFMSQHDVNYLPNGNLSLFNNGNAMNETEPSSAIEFTQTQDGKPGQIVWSFNCKMDTTNNGKTTRYGGVQDLGNGNKLISMGGLNRMVEVRSKDNTVLWDCKFLQRMDVGDRSIALYRVHFTPSLYPCYFTAQWNPVQGKGGKELIVFNEGSVEDSYVLNAYSSNGALLKSTKLGKIEAGKDTIFSQQKTGYSGLEKDVKFEVMSEKNKDFRRVLK
ncbi:MAG: aryl-sulfate sulfotransferase [Bacteroidota bacterium]